MSAPIDQTIIRGLVDIIFKVTGDVGKATEAAKDITKNFDVIAKQTKDATQPVVEAVREVKREITSATESAKRAGRSFGEFAGKNKDLGRSAIQLGQQMRFIARDIGRLSFIIGLSIAPLLAFFITIIRNGGISEDAMDRIGDAMERIGIVVDQVLGPILQFFADITEGVANFLEGHKAIGLFVGGLLIFIAVAGTLAAIFFQLVQTIGLFRFGLKSLIKEVSLISGRSTSFGGVLKAIIFGVNLWGEGSDQTAEQLKKLDKSALQVAKGGAKTLGKIVGGIFLGFIAFKGLEAIFEDVSDALSPLSDIIADLFEPLIPAIEIAANALSDFLDAFPFLKEAFGILSLIALDFLLFEGRFTKAIIRIAKGIFNLGRSAPGAIKSFKEFKTIPPALRDIAKNQKLFGKGFGKGDIVPNLENIPPALRDIAIEQIRLQNISKRVLTTPIVPSNQAIVLFKDAVSTALVSFKAFVSELEKASLIAPVVAEGLSKVSDSLVVPADKAQQAIVDLTKVVEPLFSGTVKASVAVSSEIAKIAEEAKKTEVLSKISKGVKDEGKIVAQALSLIEGSLLKVNRKYVVTASIGEFAFSALVKRSDVLRNAIESLQKQFPQLAVSFQKTGRKIGPYLTDIVQVSLLKGAGPKAVKAFETELTKMVNKLSIEHDKAIGEASKTQVLPRNVIKEAVKATDKVIKPIQNLKAETTTIKGPIVGMSKAVENFDIILDKTNKAFVTSVGKIKSLRFEAGKLEPTFIPIENVIASFGEVGPKGINKLAVAMKNAVKTQTGLKEAFKAVGLEFGEFFPELLSKATLDPGRNLKIVVNSIEEVQSGILGAIASAKDITPLGEEFLQFHLPSGEVLTKPLKAVADTLQSLGVYGQEAGLALLSKFREADTQASSIRDKLSKITKGFSALALVPLGFGFTNILQGIAPLLEDIAEPFIDAGERIADFLEPITTFFNNLPAGVIDALILLAVTWLAFTKLKFLGTMFEKIGSALSKVPKLPPGGLAVGVDPKVAQTMALLTTGSQQASKAVKDTGKAIQPTRMSMYEFGVVTNTASLASANLAGQQASLASRLKSTFKGLAAVTALGIAFTLLFRILEESDAFGDLFDAISDSIGAVAEAIAPFIDILVDWIEENPLLAGTILTVLAALVGFLTFSGGLTGVINAIAKAFENFSKISLQGAVGIAAIIGAIAALTVAFGVFLVLAAQSGFSIEEIIALVVVLSATFGTMAIAISRLAKTSLESGTAIVEVLLGIAALTLAFGAFVAIVGSSGLEILDVIALVATLGAVFTLMVAGISRLAGPSLRAGAAIDLVIGGLILLTGAFALFIQAVGASGLGAEGTIGVVLALAAAFAAILIPLALFGKFIDLKAAGAILIVFGAISLLLGVFKDFIKVLGESKFSAQEIVDIINALVIAAVVMIATLTASLVVLGALGPVSLIGALALGGVVLALSALVAAMGYALGNMADFIDAMVNFAIHWDEIKRVVLEIGPTLVEGLTRGLEAFKTKFVPEVETVLSEIPPKIVKAFLDGFDAALAELERRGPDLARRLGNLVPTLFGDFAKGMLDSAFNAGVGIINSIIDGIFKTKQALDDGIGRLWNNVKQKLGLGSPFKPGSDGVPDVPSVGVGIIESILSGLSAKEGDLLRAITGIFDPLKSIDTGAIGQLLGQITGPGGFGLFPGFTAPPVFGATPIGGGGNVVNIGPFNIYGATQPIQTAEEVRRIIREELARRIV